MATSTKKKTSLSLDADALAVARELGLNVSAIADTALKDAIVEARRTQWVDNNKAAFAKQARWHEEHAHPLADIMMSPGQATWTR